MNLFEIFVNSLHIPTLSWLPLLFPIMTVPRVDQFPFTLKPVTYKSMRSIFPTGLSFCFLSSVHTKTKCKSTKNCIQMDFPTQYYPSYDIAYFLPTALKGNISPSSSIPSPFPSTIASFYTCFILRVLPTDLYLLGVPKTPVSLEHGFRMRYLLLPLKF